MASDFVYEFPLAGRFWAFVHRYPKQQGQSGLATRVMFTDVQKLGGIDSGVLPFYLTTNIFQVVSVQVRGQNMHWGRHFVSFQTSTSKCVGEQAVTGRSTPMEVLNVYIDAHGVGYERTGTVGTIKPNYIQLGQLTTLGQERIFCAAGIADSTGVQHHNFMRTVANLRIAVVKLATVNIVGNGTIPVLWNSKTTLTLTGDGFQYGDVYISIQPYSSRCDGTTSTTCDSWPIKMTSVNTTKHGVSGQAVLGTTTKSYIGNTTDQRGKPGGRVCVAHGRT